MRYKMTYMFLLFFLFLTIPYLITVSMNQKNSGKEVSFDSYDSGYKVICQGKEKDLEQYLLEILPGQMSLDYEEEALKAQIVILRTEILRKMGTKKSIKEEKISCPRQTDERLQEAFGNKKYMRMDQKRKRAAQAVLGKVITYKGSLIRPFFHGISIGTTLSAEEWFGENIPYLKEKDSLKDIEAKEYMTVHTLTYGKIAEKLKEKKGKFPKIDDLKKDLRIVRMTKNGYVKEVEAAGISVSGIRWAKWFGLPSNNFYLEAYDGKMRIISLGKGNGLGLSQYGANEMAKEGKSYQKILKYYYSGVKIGSLP